MLTYRLQKRLDRVLAKLHKFEAKSIRMIGINPIPNVMWTQNVNNKQRPVFPSDHFGLVVELQTK